jgi:RimJ/RimL family protein N-acetyltransferase
LPDVVTPLTQDSAIILQTERLLLRYQYHSDIPFLVALWTDPTATAFLGGPRDRPWLQSALEETGRNPTTERFDLWPLIEKSSGNPVGHCGLLEKEVDASPEIELNYILTPAVWGRGYATEIARAIARHALQRLHLPRLIALIHPDNAPSKRVAINIGMRLDKEIIRPGGAPRLLYVLEPTSQFTPA